MERGPSFIQVFETSTSIDEYQVLDDMDMVVDGSVVEGLRIGLFRSIYGLEGG